MRSSPRSSPPSPTTETSPSVACASTCGSVRGVRRPRAGARRTAPRRCAPPGSRLPSSAGPDRGAVARLDLLPHRVEGRHAAGGVAGVGGLGVAGSAAGLQFGGPVPSRHARLQFGSSAILRRRTADRYLAAALGERRRCRRRSRQRDRRHAGCAELAGQPRQRGGERVRGERPVVLARLGHHRALDAVGAPSRAQRVRRRGLVVGVGRRIRHCRCAAVADGPLMSNQPATPVYGPWRVITVVGSNAAYAAALPPNSRSMVWCLVARVGRQVTGDVLECAEHVGMHRRPGRRRRCRPSTSRRRPSSRGLRSRR